jgi:hypothetical protein
MDTAIIADWTAQGKVVALSEPPDSVVAMIGDRIGMSHTYRFTTTSYNSFPASEWASPRFVMVSCCLHIMPCSSVRGYGTGGLSSIAEQHRALQGPCTLSLELELRADLWKNIWHTSQGKVDSTAKKPCDILGDQGHKRATRCSQAGAANRLSLICIAMPVLPTQTTRGHTR